MWRVAIYAREIPGRAGRRRLERQIGGLAAKMGLQPSWRHVATYADLSIGDGRPGLARLLADAPGCFDVAVVDSYGRLAANGHQLASVLDRLRWAGVGVVVLGPSAGHRCARAVANLALADLIGSALG